MATNSQNPFRVNIKFEYKIFIDELIYLSSIIYLLFMFHTVMYLNSLTVKSVVNINSEQR